MRSLLTRIPVALILVALGAPALSQTAPANIDRRVQTLESQMRAVQRQVFPGGDRRFFVPEIAPEAPAETVGRTPPTTPIADLIQRVETLESQQRVLTGQLEQLQFQMRRTEEQLERLTRDTQGRLDTLEGRTAGPDGLAQPMQAQPIPSAAPEAQPAAPAPAPSAAGTADAIEARYMEGYRLYTAGQHAAAAKALGAFAAAHPRHARASNAMFWQGRALMAQNQPAEAAKIFLAGYKEHPRGERAHNSLLWLGRALVALEQPRAACQALDELRQSYPDRITGGFATELAATRAQARCGA
jgi:TolA-binding protein